MADDNAIKPQLLCLHGWRSNSDISNIQLANLGLDKQFDVKHLEGPFKGAKAENPSLAEVSTTKTFYSWLTLSHKNDAEFEEELMTSLKKVLLHVLMRGRPYDAVYAFSQGAMIVSILSSALVRKALMQSLKKEVNSRWLQKRYENGLWKSVIATCSSNRQTAWDVCAKRFGLEDTFTKDFLKSGFILLPSIHLIGEKDVKHKKKSKAISKMYDKSTRSVFVLDIEHEVPMFVRKKYAFIPQEVQSMCAAAPQMPNYDSCPESEQKGLFRRAGGRSFSLPPLARRSASSNQSLQSDDEKSRSSFLPGMGRRKSISNQSFDSDTETSGFSFLPGMARRLSTSTMNENGKSVSERGRRSSISSVSSSNDSQETGSERGRRRSRSLNRSEESGEKGKNGKSVSERGRRSSISSINSGNDSQETDASERGRRRASSINRTEDSGENGLRRSRPKLRGAKAKGENSSVDTNSTGKNESYRGSRRAKLKSGKDKSSSYSADLDSESERNLSPKKASRRSSKSSQEFDSESERNLSPKKSSRRFSKSNNDFSEGSSSHYDFSENDSEYDSKQKNNRRWGILGASDNEDEASASSPKKSTRRPSASARRRESISSHNSENDREESESYTKKSTRRPRKVGQSKSKPIGSISPYYSESEDEFSTREDDLITSSAKKSNRRMVVRSGPIAKKQLFLAPLG